MANGYVCVRCGWQETPHIQGEWTLDEVEKSDLERPQSGFSYSFFQCQKKGGYKPSAQERATESAQAEEEKEAAREFNPGWMA